MSREFKFADLGEGITEGELVKWLVKVGDAVKEQQPVAEIETDKAIVEIPSPLSGTVETLHYKEGDVVTVGSVLITFSGEGAEEEAVAPAPAPAPAKTSEPAKTAAPPEAPSESAAVPSEEATGAPLPALATPHVRHRARELGVDIEKIKGTGPGGRVTERDVRLLAEGRTEISDVSSRLETPVEAGLTIEQFEKWGPIEQQDLKSTRRKIAQHMVQARRLTAPVTHIDEADVEALIVYRKEQQEKALKRGARLTFLPFIIRAVATGLKKYPALNASIVGDSIILKKYYNIGFAVDTDEGLLVPVIKNVADKSILDLAVELQELSERTRQRKVELADLKGSSFTITNLGSIGGRYFTPIINYPDSAILGIGKAYEKPVARDGHVVVRHVMSLNLTFDHRVTDGATGARFVNHVKERLEDPQQLFLEID